MKINSREYQNEDDFWKIRSFLRETFLLYDRRMINWHVARLDYWRGHLLANCNVGDSLDLSIFIWETDDGQIAAVLNREERGQAYLQVHPAYQTTELELAMIELAEQKLVEKRNSEQTVAIWVNHNDQLRKDILKRRGYTKGKWIETQWQRDLDFPIKNVTVPSGYTIRSLGDLDEIPARSWASWRGFHPDEPDEAYQGWEWYHSIQRCPLYRRDLDIVALAPSGEIASFCTMWFDDATRSAYIEPVATVPEHLRRGLARATITEGLQRLQKMGAVRALVCGFEPGPNALYSSTLSPVHENLEQWQKKW